MKRIGENKVWLEGHEVSSVLTMQELMIGPRLANR